MIHIETNLSTIAVLAVEKQSENEAFGSFLQSVAHPEQIDTLVYSLNNTISSKVDCTTCGNCCKTLMINVTEEEADNLATHLQQTRAQFDSTCLEKGGSMMVINTMPCHFLSNQKCTVYDYRFAGCREFPALHLPNFTKRIFTTFMHYNRCPIIYNVVEQLKIEIGFIETVITEAYY
ncbi:YkgJ family cysteine cluster protein [Parasediminibacterium paludis]|uniref:YkgJ family cysteine cluster protein n=1 Tax=Parasediminibacterium paludis TaxID=908966 RepID=A0ABV8PXF0_9BACT